MTEIASSHTLNLILLGPPGAGKGTQALAIAGTFGLRHLSTGDLIRHNIKMQTPLGLRARVFYNKGEYVPDQLVVAIVKEELALHQGAQGVVLDGFPRTVAQAEALELTLGELGQQVDAAIELESDVEAIVQRAEGRRVCANGHTYHIENKPPRIAGRCNVDGLPLQQRVDDRPETVRRRINVYQEQTEPLLSYYADRGLLRTVDGTQRIPEVTESIRDVLGQVCVH